VRAVVEGQYLRLPPQAARVFRLTGLRAWEAVDVRLACAATGLGADEARQALALLEERGLLEIAPEGGGDRYRFRPAVRFYATEAALREEGQAACAEAVMRCVDRLLRFAVPADFSALDGRWHVGPLYGQLGKGPYGSPGEAVAALLVEAGNLVEAVLAAEDYGYDDLACQLVEALYALQLKAGRHEKLLPALRAGARAADRHCPHSRTAGRMHTQLAMALTKLAENAAAADELAAARAADEQAGHLRGQATASEVLGLLRLNQWRWAEALECFEAAGHLLSRIEPGGEGHADVPRGLALLGRHRGRALRGLLRPDEAWGELDQALAYFERTGEAYNAARTRTDMADVRIDQRRFDDALELIARAASTLEAEQATEPQAELDLLRRRIEAERA
jgi:tetratricopeptide (TPR) repeat protein